MDRSTLRSTSTHVLVDAEQLSSDALVLDGDTEHHLRRVLRLRDGERVSVTDGAGRWLIASVHLDGSSLRLDPSSEIVVEAARSDPFTIAVAMPKGDRLDWLVQKVTELGVDRIVLLHADRSVVRWKPDRVGSQLTRLRRIADEACRQSRRVWRVEIDGPVEASSVLSGMVVAEPGGRRLSPEDRAVAIGPEGGWSPDELGAAADRVSLGANILRTETAAVAASALCVTFER
jgi:16S rRNA (uracil1498-N3)-methyltransferase